MQQMSNLRNEWYKRELSESESEIYHRLYQSKRHGRTV